LYYVPIENSLATKRPILPKPKFAAIFANVGSIIDTNKKLLDNLESAMAQPHLLIGRFFVTYVSWDALV
jgi:hypothetical protein